MTDKLLGTFGPKITNISLRPSSGGRHEITVNGELIYSKAATGKHPDIDQIVAEVRRRLGE